MMLSVLAQLVTGLEQGGDVPVQTVQALSDRERQQVLHGFNHGQVDFPTNDCIHERFEQSSRRSS
ncbi:hypothetical protein P4S72_13745 [Vibrio sp. PP-XX7]